MKLMTPIRSDLRKSNRITVRCDESPANQAMEGGRHPTKEGGSAMFPLLLSATT